jgi:hypothetical protein
MQSEDAEINDLITQLKQLETPYSVGAWEGFEQFREQKEDKKRRVLFYYRMAASLLILLGFGLLILFVSPSEKIKKGEIVSENITQRIVKNKVESQPLGDIKISTTSKYKPTKKDDSSVIYSGFYGSRPSKGQLPSLIKSKENENDFAQIENQNSMSNYGSRPSKGRLPSIADLKEGEFSNTSKSEIYEENSIENKNPNVINSIEFLSVKSLKLLENSFPKTLIINFLNNETISKTEDMEKKKNITKNQQLSVALIPQINQMNQISSPVNLGIGGFYKVDLSKKFAFVTGVQVSKQTINQQFEPPMFTITTAGLPQPKSAVTDWWSIEIPAQVSWRLPHKINQANVSIQTGISLAATTQKTTEYTFENTRTIITKVENFVTKQVQEIIETKIEETTELNTQNRQNFNTGILLNFSVNFSYPVGKNWLSVEPYIKNPVTNIAGEDFRFLNTGVILKWNFGKINTLNKHKL